ncbi:unnamed protein product [Scytosiphon promiscuus]
MPSFRRPQESGFTRGGCIPHIASIIVHTSEISVHICPPETSTNLTRFHVGFCCFSICTCVIYFREADTGISYIKECLECLTTSLSLHTVNVWHALFLPTRRRPSGGGNNEFINKRSIDPRGCLQKEHPHHCAVSQHDRSNAMYDYYYGDN